MQQALARSSGRAAPARPLTATRQPALHPLPACMHPHRRAARRCVATRSMGDGQEGAAPHAAATPAAAAAAPPAATGSSTSGDAKQQQYLGKKAVVVGAGPAGSCAAIALAARGFHVDVFERRPEPKADAVDTGRAYIIIVIPRGQAALQELGVPLPRAPEYVTRAPSPRPTPTHHDHQCQVASQGVRGNVRGVGGGREVLMKV